MKKVAILLMAVFLIGAAHFVFNRQPDAVIVIEALSPQELHNCGDPARLDECPLPEGITLPEGATPSNGLQVVGRGELVYLSASEASGEEVTAYAWSVSSTPVGSAATVSSTDAVWTTFRPDVLGQYTVDVMITTASGDPHRRPLRRGGHAGRASPGDRLRTMRRLPSSPDDGVVCHRARVHVYRSDRRPEERPLQRRVHSVPHGRL
jgi:hypothetical protein